MALNFNPFENDRSLKAPDTKKKLTKLKPWENQDTAKAASPAELEVPAKSAVTAKSEVQTDSKALFEAMSTAKSEVPAKSAVPASLAVTSDPKTTSEEAVTAVTAAPANSAVTANTEVIYEPSNTAGLAGTHTLAVPANLAVSAESVAPTDKAAPTEGAEPTVSTVTADLAGTYNSAVTKKKERRSQATAISAGTAEVAVDKSRGYTIVPHPFMERLFRDEALTLNQIRILLFIGRETLGWHREWVQFTGSKLRNLAASSKFTSDFWYKQEPHLIERGYLKKQNCPGNEGNLYALGPIFGGLFTTADSEVTAEVAGTAKRAGTFPAALAVPPYCQSGSTETGLTAGNPTENPLLKKSLSKESSKEISLSPTIEMYLQGCAVKKAEKERRAFQALQIQYGAEVLEELTKDPKAKAAHSLGSFLEASVDGQMLTDARQRVATRTRKLEEAKAKQEAERLQAEAEKRSDEETARLEKVFAEVFHDVVDHEHILSAFAGQYGPLADVRTPIGRAAALRQWWIERGKTPLSPASEAPASEATKRVFQEQFGQAGEAKS